MVIELNDAARSVWESSNGLVSPPLYAQREYIEFIGRIPGYGD